MHMLAAWWPRLQWQVVYWDVRCCCMRVGGRCRLRLGCVVCGRCMVLVLGCGGEQGCWGGRAGCWCWAALAACAACGVVFPAACEALDAAGWIGGGCVCEW